MSECPVDIEFGSPEHISVLIMSNYFSVTEGVLWKCIRGNGYAYGAWINFSVDYETLNWDLYRCARPKLAYQTMKNSVVSFLKHCFLTCPPPPADLIQWEENGSSVVRPGETFVNLIAHLTL